MMVYTSQSVPLAWSSMVTYLGHAQNISNPLKTDKSIDLTGIDIVDEWEWVIPRESIMLISQQCNHYFETHYQSLAIFESIISFYLTLRLN